MGIKQEIIEALAREYHIEPNEDGTYNLNDYDWQAGCYAGHTWLSLANIVYTLADALEHYDDEDY